MFGEAALSLYGLAGRLVEPLAGVWLARRERSGREDGRRRGERFGRASQNRPPGPLVWVHASSVGETIAALPLIKRIGERGASLVLTTAAVAAAELARHRLPAAAVHQYVPIDTPGAVDRFLDHWRPGLVLFVESELWPTTLRGIDRRGIPLVLVNARLSDRSYRAWRRAEPLARAVLGRVDLCLAQSQSDEDRLCALGARAVAVCGNLKLDAPPPAADESLVSEFRGATDGRAVLVAASTHPGEEEVLIAALKEVAAGGKRLLTILAPRHPRRGGTLSAMIAATGLSVSRRSEGEPLAPSTDIYLADTIGEMGTWYRLADIVFLGGSLAARGGQNPVEPIKLGVPVLHGVHVGNFRDLYDALIAAGATMRVEGADTLAAAIGSLLDDASKRKEMAGRARTCIAGLGGALSRTMDELEPFLFRLSEHDAPRPRA